MDEPASRTGWIKQISESDTLSCAVRGLLSAEGQALGKSLAYPTDLVREKECLRKKPRPRETRLRILILLLRPDGPHHFRLRLRCKAAPGT